MIVVQVEGDREAVERQVLASLWGPNAIRLTAEVVNGLYVASIHSTGDEPDVNSSVRAATQPA